jgi:hypothetical protein
VESCEFKTIHCLSPLCAHHFLARDRVIAGADVCSEQCLETFQLSEMLGKASRVEISKFFWKCIQEHRKKASRKIEEEYEDVCKRKTESRDKWDAEIKELQERLEDFKWHFHIGKFVNDVWTCCQQTKEQIGCSVLQRV